MISDYIIVDFNKKIADFFPVSWVLIMIVFCFLYGVYLLKTKYKEERNYLYSKIVDKYFIYAVLGVLIGARLGYVFFYQWNFFSQNLLQILKVWKGGFSTHGGILGLILATTLFIYKHKTKYRISYFSFFDKLMIVCLLTMSLVRVGNFISGDVFGKSTHSTKGFIFLQNFRAYLQTYNSKLLSVKVLDNKPTLSIEVLKNNNAIPSVLKTYKDHSIHSLNITQVLNNTCQITATGVPRIPTQLYEAGVYFVLFLLSIYTYKKLKKRQGFVFGSFLVLLFVSSFFLEFLKENQVFFEIDNFLNQGQILSIPFILMGFIILFFSFLQYK